MNCTALRSASASHFILGEVTIRFLSLWTLMLAKLQERLAFRKYFLCRIRSGEGLRPVLPDRARARPRRRALDAARRARALARPAALHRPRRPPAGIGTNILAARLKELEAAGIVEKRKLPPPAASTVYELTPRGQDLRPVLHELARWGARSLGPPPPDVLEAGLARARARPRALAALPRAHDRVPRRRRGGVARRLRRVEGIADGLRRRSSRPTRPGSTSSSSNHKLDGVRIEGDPRAARAAASTASRLRRAASRLSTSQARRTSSSVVRALPTASRST